ncbi:MAG: Cof-type HAD-IIB family hydrolase [Acholeplasmatales bacterium]|nr:Cof-type HAD-IIB family hydrolase [Acholeplasmatales bacterium]
MIKLICCDLDGTLLTNDKQITKENYEAIQKFRQNGGHFVLASGRPLAGVKPLIDKLNLNLDSDATLTYNGGVIALNNSGKVLSAHTIKGSLIKDLYYESQRLHTNFHFFSNDGTLYTTHHNPYTQVEERINGISAQLVDINNIDDDDEFIKAMMVGESETLDNAKEKLNPKFLNLQVVRSSKIFLEFQSNDVSKGEGLKFLRDYYNLKDEETMAIGDEENDLSMIKAAGFGVAMQNGRDSVKKYAKYITLSNEESGVAYAIKKILEN